MMNGGINKKLLVKLVKNIFIRKRCSNVNETLTWLFLEKENY